MDRGISSGAWARGEDAALDLAHARMIYSMRRRRDAAFEGHDLLGEPGWDILLDLFIGEKEGAKIQVSSVCLDAGIPSTTILRWLARLERENLIYRAADSVDGRRRFVRLTDAGRALMENALRAINFPPAFG
jgi:DNA-binding MarR family transcriptional regulator